MNRRIPLAAAMAGGGMLAAAFLPAAVAVAAPDGGNADISDNAFTGPDGFTLDPGSGGYDSLSPIFTNAPLLQLGGGEVNQLPLVNQSFDVYNGSGDDAAQVGTVDTAANASNLLGLESAQFTVTDDQPTADAIQSALSSAGLSDSDFNGGSLSDVANALADNSGSAGVGGTDSLGDNVSPEAVTNTLLLAGGPGGIGLADGTSASDIASALNSADNPLPADGTVYSITDLTSGFAGETDFGHKNLITDLLGGNIYNVYEATPNASGDAAANIQDVLVTPMGNINLSTPFDAIGFVDPTKSFAGLDVGSGNASDNGPLGGLLGNSGGGDNNNSGGGEPSGASAAASGSGSGDGGSGSDGGPSDNAFTLGGTTFDPGSSGWDHISPLAGTAPLLEIGGGDLPLTQATLPSNPVVPAQQDFGVYDGTGDDATEVGNAHTEVDAANILGIQSTQFTVDSVTPVGADASAGDITSALEAANLTDDDVIGGDVSDLGKLLAGNADTDVLGDNVSASDISSALEGSDLSLNGMNGLPGGADPSLIASDLNNAAADPDASQSDIAAALSNSSTAFSDSDFTGGDLSDVVSALQSDPSTDVLTGDVSAGDVSSALSNAGISISDSANFDTAANIANALNSGDIAGTDDNPVDGSVYSVTDFGMGIENVYVAIPGSGSDSATSIHDTLVTPFGNIDLSTPYDATADLDPGAPFEGLDTNSGGGLLDGLLGNAGSDDNGSGSGSGGNDSGSNPPDAMAAADGGDGSDSAGGSGPSDDAFTIGNFTFDPGSDGFDSVSPEFGVAPLLEVSGISTTTPLGDVDAPTQDLDVYSSNGDHLLGSVVTDVQTSNVLGIDTTELTVDSVDPASGQDAADLPETGTTYSVTDLGLGIHNVYEAVPGADGGDPTITDTLVTPLGNIDLSTPFNALADLMPGDFVGGVDAHDNSLFGGLLGGSGGESSSAPETDASASEIQSALSSDSDITAAGFSDDSSLSDVANALQSDDTTDVLGDHLSASEITSALNDAHISISDGADFDAGDIADALNDAGTSGASDDNGMGDGLLGLLGL